jgi:UPF0755 protein
MSTRRPKFAWWEYLLYGAVTIVFALLGALVVVLKFLQIIWRIIGWPARRLLRLVITLVFAAILVAGFMLYWYTRPVDLGTRVVRLVIKQGDDLGIIASQLESEGVIRSRSALAWPAQWTGLDRKLTPGRYDFTGRVSLASVLVRLQTADFVKVKVTVYEGAPVWKVAGIVARALEIDSLSVLRLIRDTAFIRSLNVPYLEGHLFPETYIVPWGTPPQQLIGEMVAMFRDKTDSLFLRPLPRNMTRYDLLKLASIIQAETRLESEQGKVSSVYLNRLRLRMRLDADPTVIYGLGAPGRPLTRADLETESPYNTYRNYGLPPTPINSPGLPAIRAALYPDTTNYLYFVADGTGGHRFSRTNEEQNRARFEIRRAKRMNQKL